MYKKILLLWGLLFCMLHTRAQISPNSNTQSATFSAPATQSVYLFMTDTTIISYVTFPQGKPLFTVAGINNIINQYTVTGFTKAFPHSRLRDIRYIYTMMVSDTQLAWQLTAAYPQYFPRYEIIPGGTLFYTPVDFPSSPIIPFRNTDYLEYINAKAAWDVTKGDTGVIIGITDTYLDITHPDIVNEYVSASPIFIDPNLDSTGLSHGTIVAGLAAAKTDSGQGAPFYGGYPGIGFQCRIDFSCLWTNAEMLNLSTRPGRRVLNGSWGRGNPTYNLDLTTNLTAQRTYQEIYENGVFSCFAAGNSNVVTAYLYAYPASLDYVFSVSGVNHVNTTGIYNVKGMHEGILGDTVIDRIGVHNSRVDLLAPYNDIGGLAYYPTDPNPFEQRYRLNNGWGTSFASPIVAGTAALMLSENPCLTPYQVEYILKKSANTGILSLAPNLKYAGRLGAGALNAGATLQNVQSGVGNNSSTIYGCNNPATATFFIEGIDINTICAPGYSNGSLPMLKPVLRNGNPNYTYRWEYMPGNNVTLSSLSVANPTITASTGNHKAILRLTVYDGSQIQKVASRYFSIQLTTTNEYDLAGADSYMDMFDEPNEMDLFDLRDNNYYKSPDLWNRQHNDGVPDHENAEYYAVPTNYNYANVRIRNVGCAIGGQHYLKLYWTVASTGENWKNDWDGTTKLAGAAGGQLPGGGEITSGNGIAIPQLFPGKDTTIVVPWRPVKPQDYYGTPNDINVCLLARIAYPADPIKQGMHTQEVTGPIITNVRENNNIFTRNLWVKDLDPYNRGAKTRILIANASEEAKNFDVQFINDKAINLHFAGNFSAIGNVTLHLGELYQIWMDAGGEGHYLSRDPETKTVVMDGSETLELHNIPMDAEAKYPVDVEFALYPDAQIPNYKYEFHLRQFELNEDHQRIGKVYGSMSFEINTNNTDAQSKKINTEEDATTLAQKSSSGFSIHPNPATDRLSVVYLGDEEVTVNITVFDMTGRKLLESTGQVFRNSYKDLDVSRYAPGVYLLNISHSDGSSEQMKFIKQ